MNKNILNYIFLTLKGFAMGAANVIPGVSGGTIALITGVFERLINAIKSFNIVAIRLLFKGKIKELIKHIDLWFLIAVFSGMIISVISLARVLKYLFESYPVFIWSFFFGLILASVFYVGKTIQKVNFGVILFFIIGTALAVSISLMEHATQNDSFFYLVICGVVAICSMILPGLSGSYVLILMGNYELVMIDSVNNADLGILIPVIIGAIVGLIAFSHLLSWIYKKYKDQTISILTGFILGSLGVLWPWKNENFLLDAAGNFILKDGDKIPQVATKYIPDSFNKEVIIAILLMLSGIIVISLIEKIAAKYSK
jgi:putative membrane protein